MSSAWAVITGGSSGLGAAFAERCAAEGAHVLLAARSGDKLDEVADRIRRRHGVQAETVVADLGEVDQRAALIDAMGGREIAYLFNNAGFGTMGPFSESDPGRVAAELNLNVLALTELSRAVVAGMVERGSGAIVNVASTAAFQAIPTMAVYAASKAYVLRFSIALWEELHATGVRVTAICPGPTDTAFFANAGDDSVMGRRRTPDQVVETTFRALAQHRPYAVDGSRNAAMAFATRFAPTGLQAKLARRVATH